MAYSDDKPLDISQTGLPALSMREKLSYGAGEIASNLAWNMVAAFLLYYYSDVALLPVAMLGTLMLVTRILDAVYDPLVGLIVDRTRSKHGRARGYLLYAPIPFGILFVLTFAVPNVAPHLKLIYAYITFGLLGLSYSLLYIPYSALLPMMTRDPKEKVQLGSFRSMGTSIGSIIVYSLTLPIVHALGQGNQGLGFIVAATVMGIITICLYFVVFANCRERVVHSGPEVRTSLGTSLNQMLKNPVWRLTVLVGLTIFIKLGILVSTMAYFTKDVLGDPGIMSVILPVLSVSILTGGFIAGFYFRYVSLRWGTIVMIVVSIVLTLLLPHFVQNRPVFVALFAASSIGSGLQGAGLFIMMTTAVEKHESMFASRNEGLLVSSVSFGLKVGMALGAAITAYLLGWAGYDPLHVTEKATTAIYHLFYTAPVVVLAVQIAIYCFYDFDSKTPSAQRFDHPQ